MNYHELPLCSFQHLIVEDMQNRKTGVETKQRRQTVYNAINKYGLLKTAKEHKSLDLASREAVTYGVMKMEFFLSVARIIMWWFNTSVSRASLFNNWKLSVPIILSLIACNRPTCHSLSFSHRHADHRSIDTLWLLHRNYTKCEEIFIQSYRV